MIADMQDPVVEADPELKIRGLALLGTIDLNLNTAGALADWTQVLAIAKTIDDKKD